MLLAIVALLAWGGWEWFGSFPAGRARDEGGVGVGLSETGPRRPT